MIPLTDKNYMDVINEFFLKKETVIIGITPTLSCSVCLQNKDNLEKFFKINPETKINFCFLDYSKYDVLQNYSELNSMTCYPKIIIFYGSWDNTEFIQGLLTTEKLNEINKKSLNNIL